MRYVFEPVTAPNSVDEAMMMAVENLAAIAERLERLSHQREVLVDAVRRASDTPGEKS